MLDNHSLALLSLKCSDSVLETKLGRLTTLSTTVNTTRIFYFFCLQSHKPLSLNCLGRKIVLTRQHRKALWHNGCPSHNLLRRLVWPWPMTSTKVAKECKNEKHKNNLMQSSQRTKNRDMRGPKFTLGAMHPWDAPRRKNYHSWKVHLSLSKCL